LKRLLIMVLLFLSVQSLAESEPQLQVGSKKFTESVILGDILTLWIESAGLEVNHLRELGGTRVLWNGLVAGDLDIYPEYTGTLEKEIFRQVDIHSQSILDSLALIEGVKIVAQFGFNNTYALGVKKETAERYHLSKISDLRDHADLVFGFTNEFMDRGDGWPGLQAAYQLPQTHVRGLDHDLAYRGLEAGSVDVIDLYSTDAEIAYYHLVILEDDLHYFPKYMAVILARKSVLDAYPDLENHLKRLDHRIRNQDMVAMNSAVKLDRQPERQVAAKFLLTEFGIQTEAKIQTRFDRIGTRTIEHLGLVVLSLTLAILIALPLGILSAKFPRFGQITLSIVGIIQTLPSLALLVFMIPLFGIGSTPAVVALFLYSLLPIVRNTHSGLIGIPAPLRESAFALGLSPAFQLRHVELPLALPFILAGIKTAAVLNVGIATIGALIGAGGYGQLILTGIRLDNMGLILEGAIPAAVMALLVQGVFDILEQMWVSPGLKTR